MYSYFVGLFGEFGLGLVPKGDEATYIYVGSQTP